MTTPREAIKKIAINDHTDDERQRTTAVTAALAITGTLDKEFEDSDALQWLVIKLYRTILRFETNLVETTNMFCDV